MEDIVNSGLNTVIDWFDDETLAEQLSAIDRDKLSPDILRQIEEEEEARAILKESGDFWRQSPIGKTLGFLEKPEEGWGPRMPASITWMQEREQMYRDQIFELNQMFDPSNPSTLAEAIEDIPTAIATKALDLRSFQRWFHDPNWGASLNPADRDEWRNEFEALDDHLTSLNQGHLLPPEYYKAAQEQGILKSTKSVDLYRQLDPDGRAVRWSAGDATPGAPTVSPPITDASLLGGHPMLHGRTEQDSLLEWPSGAPTPSMQTPPPIAPQYAEAWTQGMIEETDIRRGQKTATLDSVLSKVFYTTAFKMEDAGRPEVRKMLPHIHNTTRLLFALYHPDAYTKFPVGWNDQDPSIPESEWTPLEAQYQNFLNEYFNSTSKGPVAHQQDYYGQTLEDNVLRLNAALTRSFRGDYISSGAAVGADGAWLENVLSTVNLLELAKLYRTKGRRERGALAMRNHLDEMHAYYKQMGKSEEEIFQLFVSPGVQGMGEDQAAQSLSGDGSLSWADVPPDQAYTGPDEWEAMWDQDVDGSTGGISVNNVLPYRSSAKVLSDAITTGLQQRTNAATAEAYKPAQGLSQEHLLSMPEPFNEEENQKRMNGLPYITLNVVNGNRRKGTTFVPTSDWQADAGSQLKKQKMLADVAWQNR